MLMPSIPRFISRAAATLVLALLTTATAWAKEGDLTDFVTVSSEGTATARFAFSDHFYRVDWSGINTSQTTSVQLIYNSKNGLLNAQRNGNPSSDIFLYASESSSANWTTSHLTGLTPGQSSDGYTRNGDLATGASYPSVFKKVCTVTCLSASAPTWAWSADRSACTATFTCAEDASLTATVTATVTAADGTITASATFNGTAYSDTKSDLWGLGDGRDGSETKPYAIGSPEALALLSAYVNAGNNASGLYFEQTQDIDMSSAGNFTPIGSKANDYSPTPFKGIYDGKGFAIIGLTVNTTSPYAGLFGYMEGGTVRNVTMVNPNVKSSVSGYKYAGGIVGTIKPGTIENCNVINPTLNADYKGAICGGIATTSNTSVSGCYFYATGSVDAVGYNPGSVSYTASRIYTLTLNYGVYTSTAPAFSYGGTDYYAGTITLRAAPTGWTYTYRVNNTLIDGNTFDISADANVTVTRTLIDYAITYNLGGGTNATGNPATYTIQSATITLAAPTREGYDFGGWYANSGLTGSAVTTIATGSTGDVELWAKWTARQYTIAYTNVDGEDVTFSSPNPTSYTIESADITLVNPTRTGYRFMCWDGTGLDTPTQTVTIATGSTGDRTYNANWNLNSYAVSFDGNNATDGTMSNQTFFYNVAKALTANAYTRTGYHFAGWNTERDGSGTAYADGEEVLNLTAEHNATVTLYAQWTANTYTVHFDPVIAANGTMADQTLTYDQATTLTKNAFSTTTGEWTGWNTQADGSGTAYTDGQEVQNLTAEQGGTVTLYAQWHLQHRFNYNSGIFRCYNANNSNEVYWAYAGEEVKVEVIDATHEYTIFVTAEDGTAIAFDTETGTFTMPDQEVNITSTALKLADYLSISLDGDDGYDIVYLYDASNPTVTPTVTVKDNGTVLTEGTHYNVAITGNTGSATQMVTATVTITGIPAGGYVGTTTQEFRITPFNIANCEIRGTLEAYDNGYGVYYPLSNNVEVWNGETRLTLDTDYSIEIADAESYVVGQTYQATVKGTGDWGGTQTFTFKVVALHHTVVFDAGEGSGTMEGGTVENNGGYAGIYYLPECTFTAPDGKKFDHWVASCEEGVEKQPGDYFTAPYIYDENYVQTITVTAYWRAKATCTVTLPEQMELVSGNVTNGTALTPDGDGIYTLTVTEDVTVTATFAISTTPVTIAYVDADGTEYTVTATPLDGSETDLAAGYYAVVSDILFDHTVTLTGNVSNDGEFILILADGCTMNVGTSGSRLDDEGIKYSNKANLTIYGQSAGSGTLSVYTTGSDAISVRAITVNGGNIIANTDGTSARAIYATYTDLTINGGTVTAYCSGSSSRALVANANVVINGGTVNATAKYYGIFAYRGDITINGGIVSATSTGSGGYGINTGNTITLGWTNATDRIYASSYSGTLAVATGQALTDADGNILTGTLAAADVNGKTLAPCLQLADNADNSATIGGFSGKAIAVQLQGRTLWKDGKWNTLCLPFDVDDFTGTPLENAVVKTLVSSSFTGGTLTMSFTEDKDNLTSIEAGKPYIVKWTAPASYVAYDGSNADECSDIVNPVFPGVTVSSTAAASETEGSEWVDFVGTYKPATIYESGTEKHNLYLGAANTLYYPTAEGFQVNACRAYFVLKNGLTAGEPASPQQTNVRAFTLNFGDEETAIKSLSADAKDFSDGGAWYTLDGRRLSGKPTKSGIYVNNGRKVVIK